ncbi:MAG: glycosyltransferase family 39 protein [Candidatus Latescibacterota bacterium]|nr:MAG: glycosyltransferase family 39 protein [Candidatus Latescibacterota bacterium]
MMDKKNLRIALMLTIVAAILRVFRIGSQSLWVDEILTLGKTIPKHDLNIWDYLKYNIQGPFHSLVVYLFHFISSSDAWLRLPSALAGALSVFFFYRWVGIWLGYPTARLAATLLVVHPLHIYYSQEIRAYGFLLLFATMTGFYLHSMLQEDKTSTRLSYAVGIALGALSNFTAAFLYVVHAAIYIIRKPFESRRVWRWVVISLVILVLIAPWVYRIYVIIDVQKLVTPVKPGEIVDTQRLRGETTITASAIPYLFYTFSVGYSLGPSLRDLHRSPELSAVIGKYWLPILWVAVLFGALFAAGWWRLVRSDLPWIQVALYLLVPLGLVLILCWQNAKAFNVRYLLVSLPVYLCVIAVGVQALGTRVKNAATVLVVGTMVVSLGLYYNHDRYAKEDVRGAVDYIEQNEAADQCILVPTVTEVFDYYYDGPNPVRTVWTPWGTTRDQVEERLEKALAECRIFWYVNAREWDHDRDGYIREYLGSKYTVRRTVGGFAGVEIILLENSSQVPH